MSGVAQQEALIKYADECIEAISRKSESLSPVNYKGTNLIICSAARFTDYLLTSTELEVFKEDNGILKNVKDWSKALKNITVMEERIIAIAEKHGNAKLKGEVIAEFNKMFGPVGDRS